MGKRESENGPIVPQTETKQHYSNAFNGKEGTKSIERATPCPPLKPPKQATRAFIMLYEQQLFICFAEG